MSAQIRLFVGACLVAMLIAASPMAAAESAGDDTLQPGELVFVNVHRQPELSTTTQLDSQGNVDMPYIGNVSLKGLNLSDAGARVSMGLKSILKNPRVTITRSAEGAPSLPGGFMRTQSMQTQVVSLNNADAGTLEKALSGMSTAGGNVSYDPNTNSMILTDESGTLQNMISVIRELDQMESQITQVMIEAKIVEVETAAAKELGIRWFAQGDRIGTGYTPSPRQDALLNSIRQSVGPGFNETITSSGGRGGGLDRRFLGDEVFDRRLQVPVQVAAPGQMFLGYMNKGIDLGVMLDALVADDKAELLASPYVGTVNHKPAVIRMTEEFPYTEIGTAGFSSVQNVQFLEIGIVMEVIPHVRRDPNGERYVLVELKPEVSTAVGVSNGVPVRAIRSSNSQRIVRDGQTLVIGGIVMADNHTVVQKLPGLGNLPVFGNLFKHKERSRTSRELMIFVTPTIHDKPEDIRWERSLDMDGFGHNDAFLAALESRAEVRKD
ncbi:MAG: polysaccharide biosynthesis/export family protein [Candidatus Hydrogenedentes bacterium]|nr:polysaccharide biosynthesis/export family protein [Candidatus Hydrogenedentota bacterium]